MPWIDGKLLKQPEQGKRVWRWEIITRMHGKWCLLRGGMRMSNREVDLANQSETERSSQGQRYWRGYHWVKVGGVSFGTISETWDCLTAKGHETLEQWGLSCITGMILCMLNYPYMIHLGRYDFSVCSANYFSFRFDWIDSLSFKCKAIWIGGKAWDSPTYIGGWLLEVLVVV